MSFVYEGRREPLFVARFGAALDEGALRRVSRWLRRCAATAVTPPDLGRIRARGLAETE